MDNYTHAIADEGSDAAKKKSKITLLVPCVPAVQKRPSPGRNIVYCLMNDCVSASALHMYLSAFTCATNRKSMWQRRFFQLR